MERKEQGAEKEKSSGNDLQRGRKRKSDSSRGDSGSVASLHRSVGNQAVQRLFENGVLQAKLAVSQPGDESEREAERVAEAVMRTSVPEQVVDSALGQRVHRTEAGSAVGGKTEQRIESVTSGGKPLPPSVRSFFEPRFGRDFSDVRVHTGPEADEAARSISAEAFTHGSDVVFRSEAYDPSSRTGKQLLAHELTHVVQQNDAEPSGGGAVREANRAHQSESTTRQVTVDSTAPRVHRQSSDTVDYDLPGAARDAIGAYKEAAKTALQLTESRLPTSPPAGPVADGVWLTKSLTEQATSPSVLGIISFAQELGSKTGKSPMKKNKFVDKVTTQIDDLEDQLINMSSEAVEEIRNEASKQDWSKLEAQYHLVSSLVGEERTIRKPEMVMVDKERVRAELEQELLLRVSTAGRTNKYGSEFDNVGLRLNYSISNVVQSLQGLNPQFRPVTDWKSNFLGADLTGSHSTTISGLRERLNALHDETLGEMKPGEMSIRKIVKVELEPPSGGQIGWLSVLLDSDGKPSEVIDTGRLLDDAVQQELETSVGGDIKNVADWVLAQPPLGRTYPSFENLKDYVEIAIG